MKKFVLPLLAFMLITIGAGAQTTAKQAAKKETASITKPANHSNTAGSTVSAAQAKKPATTATTDPAIRKKHHHKVKKPAMKTKVE